MTQNNVSLNYMQQIKPDYFIHIGINRAHKTVSLDWGEMLENEKPKNNAQIQEMVVKYLQQALDQMKKAPIF